MTTPSGDHQHRAERGRWVGRWWALALACVAVVATTTLMWSDWAIGVWGSMVAFAMGVQPEATTTVMTVRTWGDADLHVIVWGSTALLVLSALPGTHRRLIAAAALFAWSAVVELAQPWFTAQRSLQWTDLLGNGIGILAALAMMLLAHGLSARARRRSQAPAARP